MTPSKIFGVCVGIFVAGAALGLGLPAPQPSDYLRGIEAAALIVTGVVIFWYTVETRELRITSDEQLALARGREDAIQRSAQARAGLIAFALRRQMVAWLEPETEDYQDGDDAALVALQRRIASKSFWESVRVAEGRLEELVGIAPTLSPEYAASVIDLVKAFYQVFDGIDDFRVECELSGSATKELEEVRNDLLAAERLLTTQLVPVALRVAEVTFLSLP